jgi:hypothetical protein
MLVAQQGRRRTTSTNIELYELKPLEFFGVVRKAKDKAKRRCKKMSQQTRFQDLLVEAAAFKSRLTAEEHLIALDRNLKASLAPFSLDHPETIDARCQGIGLYYIEAKFPFSTPEELEEFGEKWGRIRAKNVPQAMPRYYPKKAEVHKQRLADGKYIPFYLGKRLDLKKRLTEHIIGGQDSGTYSLKLRSRPDIIKGIEFQFGFLTIPIHRDGYFCVELLEHAIRYLIKPIVGKQ